MASLCKERSVAEKLGAFHLNDTSFTRPIVNDLRFCSDPSTSRLRRALLDFGLPVVEGLSLSDSLSVRKELRSEFARFTSTVFQLCHGSGAFQHSCASPISEVEEVLREESERFRRALSEVTQRSTTLRKRALVRTLVLLLASTGKLGTAASALLFHVGGGPVWDLIDAATEDAAHRLQVRKHSFLKAVQELHHMREGRSL